jgi:uncharacterized protein with NRDE domain
MCLLSVAWQCTEQLPFVFIGNRDEYHARPSAAADWWHDAPDVLGGRDLLAGGTWLGISRSGRFAVVTNIPGLPAPAEGSLTRGALVADWLKPTTSTSAEEFYTELDKSASRYGGFNLLTGTFDRDNTGALHFFAGGYGGGRVQFEQLTAGVTGLSNTSRSAPWPKLTWLNSELSRLMRIKGTDPEQLFALLEKQDPVPDAQAMGVSARPFVSGEQYGTRCSTVITVARNGYCQFFERRFGPGGTPAGQSAFEFTLFS